MRSSQKQTCCAIKGNIRSTNDLCGCFLLAAGTPRGILNVLELQEQNEEGKKGGEKHNNMMSSCKNIIR